jgi:hypothetical protein
MGHVARTVAKRNACAYRILVGKQEGKRSLGRPRRRWNDNIKIDLTQIGWGGVDWFDLAQNTDKWSALANTATIKCWEILEQLSDWGLLKKDSYP